MNCPSCGIELSRLTHVDDGTPMEPQAGDYSACWHCGQPFKADEDGVMRPVIESQAPIQVQRLSVLVRHFWMAANARRN